MASAAVSPVRDAGLGADAHSGLPARGGGCVHANVSRAETLSYSQVPTRVREAGARERITAVAAGP